MFGAQEQSGLFPKASSSSASPTSSLFGTPHLPQEAGGSFLRARFSVDNSVSSLYNTNLSSWNSSDGNRESNASWIWNSPLKYILRSSDEQNMMTWQDEVFDCLAIAYTAVGLVALIQLIRIQRRVPEYGWTTQKVFHLLNFVVNAIRASVFFFRRTVEINAPHVFVSVLLDLPGLLFFSTYSLLVLFWAEIYHQARGLPTDSLRPACFVANASIYVVQSFIWFLMWYYPDSMAALDTASKFFFSVVSLAAAGGFILYGGRLYMMLSRFPIESRGRRKKLHEVGFVTTICFTCFSIRCLMILRSGFDSAADLDVMNHPVLNFVYYSLVELVPASLVLYILRKLPPKRTPNTNGGGGTLA